MKEDGQQIPSPPWRERLTGIQKSTNEKLFSFAVNLAEEGNKKELPDWFRDQNRSIRSIAKEDGRIKNSENGMLKAQEEQG